MSSRKGLPGALTHIRRSTWPAPRATGRLRSWRSDKPPPGAPRTPEPEHTTMDQITFKLSEMSDAMIVAFANALADDIEEMAFDHTMPTEWHASRDAQLRAMCDELTRRGIAFDAVVRAPQV